MKRITPEFYVDQQITLAQVPEIAAAGIRSVICNRPDGEDYGQPDFDQVRQAAQEAGLETAWIPVTSAGMSPERLSEFATAIEALPKPILAYCRSGTRCTMLWTLTQFDNHSAEDLLRMTSDAGYDMSGLIAQLTDRH